MLKEFILRYQMASKKISQMIKERQSSALNIAMQYIKYVGHYRMPKSPNRQRTLRFFQYLNLDIFIFTFISIIIFPSTYLFLRIFNNSLQKVEI